MSEKKYEITSDKEFENELFCNPPELAEQLESLYEEIQDISDSKIIDKLNELIIKYPKSPQIKDYLCIAYYVRGNRKKSLEVNEKILKEHPDFLFARLTKASILIADGKASKARELLGKSLELQDLFPGRNLFLRDEVTAYYKTAVRY